VSGNKPTKPNQNSKRAAMLGFLNMFIGRYS
jgi:hypothetical protein